MSKESGFLDQCYSLTSTGEVRDFYGAWAAEYDALLVEQIGYVAPEISVRMLAAHLDGPGARIIDLGCGTGLAGEALSRLGYRCVDGADYSREMLAVAEQKSVYARLVEIDLNGPLDIEPASYDAAISVGAFSCAHIEVDALDRVLGIVKPGGVLCVCINERALYDMGFAAKFNTLERAGAAEILSLTEEDYHRKMGIKGWVCILRVR